jgi:N-acyl homoserine lactone hydrolase
VIRPYLAATVKGFPVYVHAIDHPAGVVLVDTGMIDSTPELDEAWEPVPHPENVPRDVVCVINTHLHFDHCGGNRLFPGVPIHVQARELADARAQEDYTIHAWVAFDGAAYLEHDGEDEVLPGVRLLPTPGHTRGHQCVLVELPLRRGSRTRSGRRCLSLARKRGASLRLRARATGCRARREAAT